MFRLGAFLLTSQSCAYIQKHPSLPWLTTELIPLNPLVYSTRVRCDWWGGEGRAVIPSSTHRIKEDLHHQDISIFHVQASPWKNYFMTYIAGNTVWSKIHMQHF